MSNAPTVAELSQPVEAEPVWDMQATKELVRARFGSSKVQLMLPSLNAVGTRNVFAQLHYQRARKRFEAKLVQVPTRESGFSPEDRVVHDPFERLIELMSSEDWNLFVLETEADLIACANSIRAALDALAHALYFATGMDQLGGRGGLPLWKVSPGAMREQLFAAGANNMAQPLAALLNDPFWLCLQTVDNLAKHRGYPRVGFSLMHISQDGWPLLTFSNHPADIKCPDGAEDIWGLLREAHLRVAKTFVNCGIALNVWLAESPGENMV